MSIIPRIKLYDYTGSSLQHTFTAVQDTNIPISEVRSQIISGFRGRGAIVLIGSAKESEIVITGFLDAADYEALIVLMDGMKSAIVKGTRYVLKMDKTSSTQYSYNVKLIEDIQFPIGEDLRNTYQNYSLKFLANAW